MAALGLIAWLVVRELMPVARSQASRVSGSVLAGELPRWSRDGRVPAVHVAISGGAAPSPAERDWLAALRRAGTEVTWSGRELRPLAVAVEPVRGPRGGVRVLSAAPRGSVVRIADGAGVADSMRVDGTGASVRLDALLGDGVARVRAGGGEASSALRDSAAIRPVLVLGQAGWEAKFVVEALEEAGWTVRARLAVAPGVGIVEPAMVAIDTGSLSAVVALDTTAARYAGGIARFARDGGGVVLAGDAASIPALRALATGTPGVRVAGAVGGVQGAAAPLDGVGAYPIVRAVSDALPLSRSRAGLTIAARREGLGRVVQVGYDESWRWRMLGGDAAPAEHRAWWSAVVAGAARASHAAIPARDGLDDAPLARLVQAIGVPDESVAVATGSAGRVPTWLIAALLGVVLLAEWASRRFRGAK